MMKNFLRTFGALFIIAGLLITLNPISTKFTGFAISENENPATVSLAGIWLIATGWSLLLIKRQKKGQAAMEFLMTYGWAILATIVAIGAIIYLGVFTGKDGIKNSPLLTPPLIANSAVWDPIARTYSLNIENGGAIDLTLTILRITKPLTGETVCEAPINAVISPGNAKDLTMNCQALAGITGIIEIGYTWYGSSITHTSTGGTGQIPLSGQGGGIGSEPFCSNGIIEQGEQCDDGNTANGDGCDELCQIEPGFVCEYAPSICFEYSASCGNGGQCQIHEDCPSPQTCDSISHTCVDGTEECDDGNTADGDGCSATCTIEESTYECNDGEDNDLDGLIDLDDPDCEGSPEGTSEGTAPQCNDGIDNDLDGFTDYLYDPSCKGSPDGKSE